MTGSANFFSILELLIPFSATEEFFVEAKAHFSDAENTKWAARILVVGTRHIREVDPSTAADVLVLDREHLIDAEMSSEEGSDFLTIMGLNS